jgi:hypothetical protein
MKLGFWEKHDATARKGRITQAAAIIFAANPNMSMESAVNHAFKIEALVSGKVDEDGRRKTS